MKFTEPTPLAGFWEAPLAAAIEIGIVLLAGAVIALAFIAAA